MDPKCSPMRGSYSEISSHEFTPLSTNRSPQVPPRNSRSPPRHAHSSLAGRKLHLQEEESSDTALELNNLASSDEENGEDHED